MRATLIFPLMVLTLSACAAAPATTPGEEIAREQVVLLHGFARSRLAMWSLSEKLEDAGYKVVAIGYGSLTQDIDEIKAEVFSKINECCAQSTKPVHFVGHSLGGLLVRAYLGEYKIRSLGRVVVLGSPSNGSEAVDYYRETCFFRLAGPAAAALGTGSKFLKSLKPPTYPLGVIAGDRGEGSGLLPGNDDGLVRVESTKVVGMKDFLAVTVGHSALRWDDEVARQTIHFLRNGSFDRKGGM